MKQEDFKRHFNVAVFCRFLVFFIMCLCWSAHNFLTLSPNNSIFQGMFNRHVTMF